MRAWRQGGAGLVLRAVWRAGRGMLRGGGHGDCWGLGGVEIAMVGRARGGERTPTAGGTVAKGGRGVVWRVMGERPMRPWGVALPGTKDKTPPFTPRASHLDPRAGSTEPFLPPPRLDPRV